MLTLRNFRFYEGGDQGSNPAGAQGAQGANPPAGGGAGGVPSAQGAGGTAASHDLQAKLEEVLRDNATYRKELGELKKYKEDTEAKNLTQSEKLAKEKADADARSQQLETELKETRVRSAIERQARKLSIVDEDAAYALLDKSKIAFGDDGLPTHIDHLLSELVKNKPYLLGEVGSGGAGNPARTRTLTREAIRNMTPDQINANWDEVQKALRDG